MQPHKHHDGEINARLVKKLQGKLISFWKEISDWQFPAEPGWEYCRHNWCEQFYEAMIRLERLLTKLTFGMEADQDDTKVVDICFSIIDDYEKAKTFNFLNPNADNI